MDLMHSVEKYTKLLAQTSDLHRTDIKYIEKQ